MKVLVQGWLLMSAWFLAAGAAHGQQQPGIPWTQQKSGAAFLSAATREQQDDLTVNPGMLWVEKGLELWNAAAGGAAKSCASCHGEPGKLAGVSARYPAWDAKAGRLHSIETRIQHCVVVNQRAGAIAPESEPLLALSAVVAHQSHGKTMAPVIDGPSASAFEAGRTLHYSRVGQLNLSCAQCHEQNWGQRLRAETVSQGHSNGYPTYRLEWQKLGSLYRRLRGCFNSVRSIPPVHGSPEHLSLELYLAWRATGLAIETPAVRR